MEIRKNRKKIIIFSIIAIVVLALLAGVLYYIFKPEKGSKLDTLEVAKGDIIQTLEKTAAVSSNEKGDFVLIDGMVVKTVNVKVGQTVKKGAVLATFDTSSFQKLVDEKYESYSIAKAAYDKYISNSSSASSQLSQINKEISKVEKEIKNLEKIVAEQKKEASQAQKPEVPEDATTEQQKEIEKLKESLINLIDDTVVGSKLIQLILKNSESAQQVIDSLKGVISTMGENAGSIDMSQIQEKLESSMNTITKEQTDLIEAQLKLAELKTRKATVSVSADSSMATIYKKVSDSAYDAYITAKETVDAVATGWVAKYDGIVSKVDIKEGQTFKSENGNKSGGFDIASIIESITTGNVDLSSMLSGVSSGSASVMTVEYFPLTASFKLGKTEVSKVDVGQKVDIVLNSDEKVSGTVVYKSAIASESNGLDISSVINGGGSSASGGVEVKVQFDEYTDNVIIGFDVEISIKTDESEDTIAVPIESIQYENSKAYVYKYDPEEKIITKTEVTIGLRDDLRYEIKSGCEVGDIIVKSPTSTLEDGQKIHSNVVGKTVK